MCLWVWVNFTKQNWSVLSTCVVKLDSTISLVVIAYLWWCTKHCVPKTVCQTLCAKDCVQNTVCKRLCQTLRTKHHAPKGPVPNTISQILCTKHYVPNNVCQTLCPQKASKISSQKLPIVGKIDSCLHSTLLHKWFHTNRSLFVTWVLFCAEMSLCGNVTSDLISDTTRLLSSFSLSSMSHMEKVLKLPIPIVWAKVFLVHENAIENF